MGCIGGIFGATQQKIVSDATAKAKSEGGCIDLRTLLGAPFYGTQCYPSPVRVAPPIADLPTEPWVDGSIEATSEVTESSSDISSILVSDSVLSGVPNWLLALSALSILGGVAYVATRKKRR